jgi:hypothetical protein
MRGDAGGGGMVSGADWVSVVGKPLWLAGSGGCGVPGEGISRRRISRAF